MVYTVNLVYTVDRVYAVDTVYPVYLKGLRAESVRAVTGRR